MFLVKIKPYETRAVIKAYDKNGKPTDCVIVVARVTGGSATIGIDCPKDILIDVANDGKGVGG